MLGKRCGILLILIGLLIGAALADSSFQPIKALNINESNKTLNSSSINSSSIGNESIRATMLKLPLSFIENRGQSSDEVKFMVKTPHETIYFTPSEVLFGLASNNNTSIVKMSFEGSKPGKLIGEELLPGIANFFMGNNSSQWITDIPTYRSVRYIGLYPGVDLVFKGVEGNLKHELVLNPGADPASIVLTYSGQDNLSLDKDGSILIRTATGNLTDSAPVCYQDINGTKVTVEGTYRKVDDNRIGFEVQNYNLSYPLVIDPSLKYSTYLGGGDTDVGRGIAVDSSGDAYVTGYTRSTDFPIPPFCLPGTCPYQYKYGGGYGDIFVTKIDPSWNGLVYSTYLGGSGWDEGYGIAVDSSGNAYVTGFTWSTDFPRTTPYLLSGGEDAFAAKLNPTGSGLVYSSLVGGNDIDEGYGVAVDGAGNAYITGFHGVYGVGIDAFVTRLGGDGHKVYSTYALPSSNLGGSGVDEGEGIAVDGAGNAYVTGGTDSTDFPVMNPYQGTYGKGLKDAFVVKLDSSGNRVYSTYLWGSGWDEGYGIAVDSSGNAYVTGDTDSPDFPLPTFCVLGTCPYQAKLKGASDVFVTKLNPTGSALVYSSYLGGGATLTMAMASP